MGLSVQHLFRSIMKVRGKNDYNISRPYDGRSRSRERQNRGKSPIDLEPDSRHERVLILILVNKILILKIF